jgi:hypothetical protein
MVCMDMCINGVIQCESEATDFSEVTLHGDNNWIDQDRPSGFFATEEVSVGTRKWFKQLAKNHGNS